MQWKGGGQQLPWDVKPNKFIPIYYGLEQGPQEGSNFKHVTCKKLHDHLCHILSISRFYN